MPDTTHAYMGIYDGKGFVDEVRKSALLKLAEEQIEDNLGNLIQFHLEGSNVDPVTELVSLIETQRAFEMNSQALKTADEMQQSITNLRRF